MGPWTETEGLGEISPEGSEEKTRNDVIISGVDESLPSPIIIKYHYLKDAEYIMRNTGLEEAQAGIKISRRNISNLRYADDTSLMAETEEELESLFMKVKVESEKLA